MNKRLLIVAVALLALTACGDDTRNTIKAQRDQQYNQLATADAASALNNSEAVAMVQLAPAAVAPTSTPLPTTEPAPTPTMAPTRNVHFVVTPIPAVEVAAGD